MTAELSARVVVAIPAYNEAETIRDVAGRVRDTLRGCDLLVVNDGSQDETGIILKQQQIRTATHLVNLGYSAAIHTAIRFAAENDYEALITLDADGQHHPEQVSAMYHEFQKERWDYLIGSRFISPRHL